MSVTTRLDGPIGPQANLGVGHEVAFMHYPVIRPHHHWNLYDAVEAHQCYESLHDPIKPGNKLTTPGIFERMPLDSRRVLYNLETTPVAAARVGRIVPPQTSVDLNQHMI